MARSPLFGRRIHIAGSLAGAVTGADVQQARQLVSLVVKELVKRGANFVVPVDAEPKRDDDGLPICFDWLVWSGIRDNLSHRPTEAPGPLAIAVQHHKNEEQIPAEYVALWDELRSSPFIAIENAASWNMNSKRMEIQERLGDVLVALGGTEGVLFLSNLYHDSGKPVIPLNLPLCPEHTGARHLYRFGLSGNNSSRLFRTEDGVGSQTWLNRIRFPERQSVPDRGALLLELLEALERPRAFCVRLLNPKHPDFIDVQNYFDNVVRPVMEIELGYRLIMFEPTHELEYARLDQEIFSKLHRSSTVIADLTGDRPNCFLELGYALGRGIPTMVTAREGTPLPFDIATLSGLLWDATGLADDRRRAFRSHWRAIRGRPALVAAEPLIP